MKLTDPRIEAFTKLVNKGIEAWTEAGRLLCEITTENPLAYVAILEHNPHLTRETLESFERIGRQEIYPYLLVDPSPGAKRLAALPYKTQIKLYSSSVTLAVKRKGGYEQRRKRVTDLSAAEAALVFDLQRIRTAEEQMKILNSPKRTFTVHATSRREDSDEHETNEATEPEAATLDETPKAELVRLLTRAHQALIDARTALAIVKRDCPKDALITTALNAVGTLRLAVNEDDL